MASNFLRKTSRNIGTSPTVVGTYTVAAATQTTAIGLSLANITTNSVNVTVTHSDGTNTTTIIKNAPIPAGGALVVIGGDQKVVMQTGDSISVTSSAATSIDAYLSILEIT